MKQFILFFILLIHFSPQISAQSTNWVTVILEIQNEFNQKINDAYVSTIKEKQFIGASNNGLLYFESQLPNQVLISHISYEHRIVDLNENGKMSSNKDSLFLIVILQEKSYDLIPVDIAAEENPLFYKKESAYVADYAFYENATLLLLGIGNQRILRLIDNRSNSLAELEVKGKNLKLLQDCFRNIHLISKDSIFQIHFTDSSFKVGKAFEKEKYENSLMNCKSAIGQTMMIGFEDKHQQDIRYYLKKDGIVGLKKLKHIKDQRTKDVFHDFEQQYAYLRAAGKGISSSNNSSEGQSLKELDYAFVFFKHALSDPLYCPVYNSNNTFVLFDHFSDSISFYRHDGKRMHQIPINYHLKQNWERHLIHDYYTGDVYSVYNDKNRLYVQQINLTTGQLVGKKIESLHPFPSNLQIREGKLYYLHQNFLEKSSPQQLFFTN